MTDLTMAKPIFAFTRKGVTEVVVHGIVALKHQGDSINTDDVETMIVVRSLLKPWQVLATGGVDTSKPFWVMGVASHSGQAAQMEQLHELMAYASVSESDLVCPRSMPMDSAIANAMRSSGLKGTRLHHPCAGKHLVMLAAAKQEGAPLDSYWHEDHPVQRRIQSLVGKEAREKLTWITDSCGLPVAVMPVRVLMNMYERFALDASDAATKLKSLWLNHPGLVGGSQRLDSDICKASNQRMIAKEGADGLLMVQTLPLEQSNEEGIAGCFVKISSGYNAAHLGLAIWSLLSSRADLNAPLILLRDYLRSRLEEWVPKDQELQILYRP